MTRMDKEEHCQRWLTKVNQTCGHFNAQPLGDDVMGELEPCHNTHIKLSTVTTRGINLFRTYKEIALGHDGWFYLVFQQAGEAVMAQQDRQTVLQAGDMTLIDAALPCSFWWQDKSTQISLMLPRQLLDSPLRPPGAQRLAGTQPMVQMCQRLLQESMQSSSLTGAESDAALAAMVCLLRPLVQQQTALPTRRERLFEKVLGFIDENIQAEELRPAWIARENGMSLRSLYRMFADQGLVVAQFIKHRRLDLCAQQLRLTATDEKLATIGHDWGFTDQSHFSTAFKQRFGLSPGEYRKRCR
ncbi:transcriptional regulator FeaR [Vagococcus sp. WN89Y]|uniref:transcriptional regulator FeaR n=1 Tax=Vagococcus sp. WN89Y TaxID=3457258 RepID=UPI003FCDEF4F